jgi:hypothetical protein
VCCAAILVLAIMASDGEYRHRTVIPAILITSRHAGVPGTRRVREASFAALSGAIPGHNGSVTLVQRAGPPTSPAAHAGEATTEPCERALSAA